MTGLDNALNEGDFNERNPFDFYPTPWGVIEIVLTVVRDLTQNRLIRRVLDVGAGTGRWGTVAHAFWPDAEIYGYDNAPFTVEQASRIEARGYTALYSGSVGDYLNSPHGYNYDLVMGNPPFYMFSKPAGKKFFPRILHQYVNNGAIIALFAPTSFHSTDYRYQVVLKDTPPLYDLRFIQRVSFYPEGHPQCGDSNARLYCAPIWARYGKISPLARHMPQTVYIPTHDNDNTYTGQFKGIDTWQEMCDLGLVPSTDKHYLKGVKDDR